MESGNTFFFTSPFLHNTEICKRFRLGMQEDAHECLRYILDGLQNEALRPYKREQLRKLRKQHKGDESTKPMMKQVHVPVEVEERTWVHQLFGGHLSSCVHCTECGHDSVTTDPFLDLSLDIRQCSSVGDALNKFGRKDVLDGDNKYRCSGCEKLVRAYKYFRIDRPPLVLTLHLKRFECNLYGGSSKIGKKIEYPLRLQLPVHVDDGTHSSALVMYDLVGVLIHEGFSMHSGHYYAYIKSIAGQWYEADDESVRQVNVKTALSQSAYILVYVRNPNAEPVLVEEKHPETTKPPAKKPVETVELSDDDDEDDSDFVIGDDEDEDSEDESEDSDEEDDDVKETRKPTKQDAMDRLRKALEEKVEAKRTQREDVMELLQKTHAGSLFHANDLPTWDDDDEGEEGSESEGEESTGQPPRKKHEGGADSPSHWTKKAIMRERHTLIARSTPKALRPSKWDEEYDQPKLPKVRTEVVKPEDVSGKFDDFLTSAAKKKKNAIVVGDEDDGVHSSCSVPATSSGFKSNWSKKLQKRLMEQNKAKEKPAGKFGGHDKARGKPHGKHEKRGGPHGGKHGGFRGGKHGKPRKFGGPKGKKAFRKK